MHNKKVTFLFYNLYKTIILLSEQVNPFADEELNLLGIVPKLV